MRAAPQHAPPTAAAAPARRPPIQTKIRVGPVDDPLEREADRVADQVMRMPAPGPPLSSTPLQLSRKCAACQEEEEKLQKKDAGAAEHAASDAPASVHVALRSPGQPLDPATRAYFEPRFGSSFSAVRVHADSAAAESARAVDAVAYTVGQHVVFGASQYAPDSDSGRYLLAHELAHTLQQKGGVSHLQAKRSCYPTPCPRYPIEFVPIYPLSSWAEDCIQNLYADSHSARRGVSLSFNDDWRTLTGGNEVERLALGCLRKEETPGTGPNFTARSGMYGGEPDIWDFRNGTMYEITSSDPLSLSQRHMRLGFEINLANHICGPMECGGLQFSRGGWSPPDECFMLPGKVFKLRARNQNGVITYDILIEGESAALAAAATYAAWRLLRNPQWLRAAGATAGRALGALVPELAPATARAAAGAGEIGGALRTSLSALSTGSTAGGAAAPTAAAVTESAAAAEAGLAAGGASAVVAGALPVIAMVGVFVALGAGYAQARADARNESAASGFSQGFVMGLLGWAWGQAVDRFGKFSATPTPWDEALGFIKANAYNRGLKAGFETAAALPTETKTAYLQAIRKVTGPRRSKGWSRIDQVNYVIELAAVARTRFLRPE